MENTDFAIKMYEASTSHFLTRVRQRDSVLLFFVAAVGTIFGLTSEQGTLGKEFLLAIPYVGCVCGVMMAYHSLFIEALQRYCQQEIAHRLGAGLKLFEGSRTFATIGMHGVILRSTAYVLLLLLPIWFALWDTWQVTDSRLWYTALAMGLVGVMSILYADIYHVLNVRRRVREWPVSTPASPEQSSEGGQPQRDQLTVVSNV